MLSLVEIARWVRRWTVDHSAVLIESSRPPGDFPFTEVCFCNDVYISFMLGLVDFSDIAILCNGPNDCYQQNLKRLFSFRFLFMKEKQ